MRWRYKGSGGPGTDYIVGCALDLEVLNGQPSQAAVATPEDILKYIQLHDTLDIFEMPSDVLDFFGLPSEGGSKKSLSGDDQAAIKEIEAFGCDVVTKTWVDDNPLLDRGGRFVGGGLFAGDLQAAERNRERANASAVVASTPRAVETGIRPPSTGDGGLLD